MPKQLYKLQQFHGGLNSDSDPRDIASDELASATDVVVDELGKIRLMGGKSSAAIDSVGVETSNARTQSNGYGLFPFKTDREEDGTIKDTSWYAIYNATDDKIDLLSSNGDQEDAIDFVDGSLVSYYFADGGLRVCDSNFTNANASTSKVRKFISNNLFHTTDIDTSGDPTGSGTDTPGTPLHIINQWSTDNMQLKSLNDLSVAVNLVNAETANPSTSYVEGTKGKVTIAWWKADNGNWNGVYELGITTVYNGNQESHIDDITGSIALLDEKLNIQIYINEGGEVGYLATNAAHMFADDRISGLNIYFRAYGSEEWTLLQKIDLITGGKHHWMKYDVGTDTLFGIFPSGGSVTLASPAATNHPDSNNSGQWAYTTTTTSVTIANTADGFTGRVGFLRIYGFAISPIYKKITSLSGATHSNLEVITPSEGRHTLYCELLDEQFNLLAKSAEISVNFSDAGRGSPAYGEDPPDISS